MITEEMAVMARLAGASAAVGKGGYSQALKQRYSALRMRIQGLSSLRKLVGLPPGQDILERQWSVIEAQLNSSSARLLARINSAGRTFLPGADRLSAARTLNHVLGEAELDLSRAFDLFDTYMDLLTQRLTPELGRLLTGCDALAWDAISRRHPALEIIEPPLVYCDRGFGARTMREGVPLPDQTRNPLPIIEIPYSKLKEKYNLTSVLHEVGHEVMVRLNLVSSLPKALRYALRQMGASETLQNFFGLWTFEIGPDFWAFCASGLAAAGGIREILALPPAKVYHIAWTDPHPPPYLRVPLTFECCRQAWGAGPWDGWEAEWYDLYPLEAAPPEARAVLREGRAHLTTAARALLRTRFKVLQGRTIPDLFYLPALAPGLLEGAAHKIEQTGRLPDFGKLSPTNQLAVFRLIRERGTLDEERLDAVMSDWLFKLGSQARPGPAANQDRGGK